jgi:hypothetical protein
MTPKCPPKIRLTTLAAFNTLLEYIVQSFFFKKKTQTYITLIEVWAHFPRDIDIEEALALLLTH